jgi:regulator of sigma E protease
MTASVFVSVLDYALPFLAVIGILVLVHEFGHFWAARALGIRVTGFSLGMGPELAGWTDRQSCRWSLRLLPIGGFVKFWGDENAASANSREDDGASMTQEERAVCYRFRPPGHRAVVLLGGPAANFALGLVVLVLLYGTYGRQHTPPLLSAIAVDGPAAAAGFREGDLVVAVDGSRVERFEDLQATVSQYPDRPLRVTIRHAGGVEETLTVTPKATRIVSAYGTEMRIGRIGVQASGSKIERVSPIAALDYGVRDVWFFMKATARSLGEIVMGWRSLDEIGGPVKIVQVAGGAFKLGIVNLVFILAVLSINLGVINLAPFPVLDGGHLALCAYEVIVRRKASPAVLDAAFRGGAALILVLMLVISWNDVSSLYRQMSSPDRAEAQQPPR